MAEVILLSGGENDLITHYVALHEFNPFVADKFSSAIDAVFEELESFPQSGSIYAKTVRRKLVPGFYQYGIFYTIAQQRVMIHAILHLQQNPDLIRNRISFLL